MLVCKELPAVLKDDLCPQIHYFETERQAVKPKGKSRGIYTGIWDDKQQKPTNQKQRTQIPNFITQFVSGALYNTSICCANHTIRLSIFCQLVQLPWQLDCYFHCHLLNKSANSTQHKELTECLLLDQRGLSMAMRGCFMQLQCLGQDIWCLCFKHIPTSKLAVYRICKSSSPFPLPKTA